MARSGNEDSRGTVTVPDTSTPLSSRIQAGTCLRQEKGHSSQQRFLECRYVAALGWPCLSGTRGVQTPDARNSYHFLASGQQALPMDSQGNFWTGAWTGANVFSSGNLKLDLLHNFFLECGARASKIRVYETVDDPTARACVGFLLVRGGVHIVAYAKALEKLSGVDVGKLLPIPDISNKRFPEAAKHEARGLHRIL
ncbi:MAG: manganese catalase family protein, partial [Gemmatimonadales bacterium]|nr:manganese catalase family protein [Gemmatimonadales bacterium]